jgi:hypothetical protein
MENSVEALIAEINSDLSKYADAGLIDENSIYRDIVKGLKKFGNNMMELQETVLEVKNYKAVIPEGFYSLYLAYLCKPLYYKTNDEFHDLQNSLFYIERTETKNKWNECDTCCTTQEEKIIKENLYFRRSRAEFYYHEPQLLKLGKSFKKSECHRECRNKFVKDNPNEIIINSSKNILSTNFKEGSIYMQYYGLPVDEDGAIIIPDVANGIVETYLEYRCKRRLAERLIGNNDALGLAQLFPHYSQQEQIELRNASRVLSLSKINPKTLTERIVRLNRSETLSFEVQV